MPIQRCSNGDKSGFRYGNSGRCYTGPGAKKKAQKQAVAINLSQKRAGKTPEWDKNKAEQASTLERMMENL